jgi:HAMP domain-containing protein
MDWWNGLDADVQRYLLLAAAALVGALVAMVAMPVGARRGARSVLTLLERHSVAERARWETEARDRRELAMLRERQHAYATMLAVAWRYEQTTLDLRRARRDAETPSRRHTVPGEGAGLGLDPRATEVERPAMATAEVSAMASAHERLRDDLARAREMVRLLAPTPVRQAADLWFVELLRGDVAAAKRAQGQFLAHARRDIGADPREEPTSPDR